MPPLKKNVPAVIAAMTGLLLAAAAAAGFLPMASIARLMAPDHAISPQLSHLLASSQWSLALLLITTPLLSRLIPPKIPDLTSHPRLPWLTASIAFLGALVAELALFDAIPHVTDAVSHWFQARIFAAGHIYARVPPCHECFYQDNLIMSPDGKWHTKYFPGNALWIAPFMKLHAPWLALPLLFAAATASLHKIVRRLYDAPTALIAALLFASSPMNILLAASYMSHLTFVCFAVIALALALDAQGNPRRLLAAGTAAGLAFITRPQDCLPLALAALPAAVKFRGRLRREKLTARLIPFAAGVGLPLLFLAGWNKVLYNSIAATGYNIGSHHVRSLTPLIHDSLGFTQDFTPHVAVQHAVWTLLRFNKALFGWPTSFFFIPLALAVSTMTAADLACWIGPAAVLGMYFFFPYYGFEYEARYYAPAVPFLAVLSARGITAAARLLSRPERSRRDPLPADSPALPFLGALLLVFFAHALVFYWPKYLVPRYAGAYESVSPVIKREVSRRNLHNAVVLVPSAGKEHFRYASGFVYNDPGLAADVIYARDIPQYRPCLADAFSGRALKRFTPSPDWNSGRLDDVPVFTRKPRPRASRSGPP